MKDLIKHQIVLDHSNIESAESETGLITFKKPVVVSNDTEHWNGRKYDVPTMDVSKFTGKLFSDHWYGWTDVLGKVIGLKKNGKDLTIGGLHFAVDSSAWAILAFDMVRNGWVTDLSVGVQPEDWDDRMARKHDDGDDFDAALEKYATLVEISLVGIGNNPDAKIQSAQELVANSLAHSRKAGLSTDGLAAILKSKHGIDVSSNPEGSNHMKLSDILKKNAVDLKDVEKGFLIAHKDDLNAEQTKKFAAVLNEADGEGDAPAGGDEDADGDEPKGGDGDGDGEGDEAPAGDGDGDGDEDEDKADDKSGENSVNEMRKLRKEMAGLKKQLFSKGGKAPAFKAGSGAQPNSKDFKGMSWREITALQIQSFAKSARGGDVDAAQKLQELNAFNKSQLKERAGDLGLTPNVIDETDFGNFVVNPELITEIEGQRNDYSALLQVFPFQQTNALEMAWLQRSGDISMEYVSRKRGADNANPANRKPISEYGATAKRAQLEELAAVTPVVNAATMFLAVDLVGDVAQGYRNDYDRKRAQLVIARLQQAVEDHVTPNSIPFTFGTNTPAEQLEQLRKAIFAVSQNGNGIIVFTEATYGLIAGLLFATGNGNLLSQREFDGQTYTTVWGKRYVVVPNDLMPTLGDDDYKTFEVGQLTDPDTRVDVDITHGLFYVDPNRTAFRDHNGLSYDLSTQAAYVEPGGQVQSAFQNNEVLLRGSMWRGGAVKDTSRVAAVRAQDLAS